MKDTEVKRIILSFKGGMTPRLSNCIQKALAEFIEKEKERTWSEGAEIEKLVHEMMAAQKAGKPAHEEEEKVRMASYRNHETGRGIEYAEELLKNIGDLHTKHLLGI